MCIRQLLYIGSISAHLQHNTQAQTLHLFVPFAPDSLHVYTALVYSLFSFQVSLLILTFLLPLKGCCNNEYSRFPEAYPTASFYPWFCDNIFQSLHILLLFVALDGYVDGENDQPNFSSSYRHILLSNHI